MKLDDALQGVSSLAFDTAPIIYFVEANPSYDKLSAKGERKGKRNSFMARLRLRLSEWRRSVSDGRRYCLPVTLRSEDAAHQ